MSGLNNMAQQFEISADESKKAKIPHDLLLINLIFNHIFVFVACLTATVLFDYILIVPILSALLLVTVFIGAKRARLNVSQSNTSWYVSAHWQLCARRSLVFLCVLGLLSVVFALLYWVSDGNLRPQHWALAGASALPVMVTVLVLIVMESEALQQAETGVLPNWVREKFTHNAPMPVAEQLDASSSESAINFN